MTVERIRVALLQRPWGVQGWIRALPLTGNPQRLLPGAVADADGQRLTIVEARQLGRGLALRFDGIGDRTQAAGLSGRYLTVSASELPPPPPGSYYHFQLIGLEVCTQSGVRLGRISDVVELPANDVWTVSGERAWDVPAVRQVVLEVSLERGQVVVADWITSQEEA